MPVILGVAEKPSVAKELARILHGGDNCQSRAGHSKFNRIYEAISCMFRDSQCTMNMTSVTGHMMGIEFPDDVSNWQTTNPLDLFDVPLIKRVSKESENIEMTLKEEAKRANILLLFLDGDLEGENIAYEVISVCLKSNRNLDVYRARFSALIPRDIMRTMRNPERPNPHMSDAVDARQEIDLRIGAAFTRFQTLRLKAKFGIDHVVSYGPCQFPTLGFVVEQYQKIKNFTSEEFWSISCDYEYPDNDEQSGSATCHFTWERNRLFDRLACILLFESCLEGHSSGGVATVTKCETKPSSKSRPTPLNTVELQKRASRLLHISSDRTMAIAEALYVRGILSYPRTETDFFKEGTDLHTLIGEHRHHSAWGGYASALLDEGKFLWPRQGSHDDQAHPPIHPTKCVELDSLDSDDERKIYDFVTRHFLAACSMDAAGNETKIYVEIGAGVTPGQGGELFSARGLMIERRSFLEVYSKYEKWAAKKVPLLKVGDTFVAKSLLMKSGKTEPPQPINESDLIAEMDREKIGTDATIASHIATIQTREYVRKDHLNRFIPTDLGLALIEGYNNMGYHLNKPFLRAAMEADCQRIARGELNKDEVVRRCLLEMRDCFQKVTISAHVLDSAVSKYYSTRDMADVSKFSTIARAMAVCGQCKKQMDLKQDLSDQRSPRVLHCENCKKSYSFRSKGEVSKTSIICPLCEFGVIKIVISNKGTELHMCPYCNDNPPDPPEGSLESQAGNFVCWNCAHDTCSLAGRLLGGDVDVAPCKEGCGGSMRLKKKKDGSSFFLSCNKYPACKVKAFFLPSFFKSVVPQEQVVCKGCSDACGVTVHKLLLTKDFAKAPPFVSNEPFMLCVGCDRLFQEIGHEPFKIARSSRVQATHLYSNNSNNQNQPTNYNTNLYNNTTATTGRTGQQVTTGAGAGPPPSDYGGALSGKNNFKSKSARGSNNSNSNSNNNESAPSCSCKVPAHKLTVKKDGPNQGKEFWGCADRSDKKCQFFKWA